MLFSFNFFNVFVILCQFQFPVKSNARSYESRHVQNHTECQCVYKNHHQLKETAQNEIETTITRSPFPATTKKNHRCRCTFGFRAKIEDGQCMCVCEAGNQECKTKYDGRETLSLRDQR